MKATFYLRKEKINKDGSIPIALLISGNGVSFRRNVKGLKTKQSSWQEKTRRIRPNRANEEYNFHIEYNKNLDEIDIKLKELFRYVHLNNCELTKQLIITKLENESEAYSVTPDFFKSFQDFMDTNTSIKAKRTITGYKTTKNFIENFVTDTNYDVKFSSIDLEFFDRFRAYSFDIKNTNNNYFAKIISILKTFMKWAADRDLHDNHKYTKFIAKEERIEVIYLTENELMTLFNKKFDSKKLRHVRDVYCFGCFTGLRYSDIKALRSYNIMDDSIIFTVQKTKTKGHEVPLVDMAKEILARYKDTIYSPLPVISSQKFNEYIKDCCKMAEINSPVTTTRYIGHKAVTRTEPKYKFITSHTARKTFATISLTKEVPVSIVKDIMAHTKYESLAPYVKISVDASKRSMAKAWNK